MHSSFASKSIYFDINKQDLRTDAIQTLDSLISSAGNGSYLVELYGYADSSAAAAYNLRLSQMRIESVRSYIASKTSAQLRFREKNKGEDNVTHAHADLSMYRRVDIYFIPLAGNKIKLGRGNESVEVPADHYEPCGVCGSEPSIKAYYTAAAAERASIRFATRDGMELETAGTFNFESKSCNTGSGRGNDTLTFRIKAENIDPEMTLWYPDTVNGIIYWKPAPEKPEFDSITNTYIIRTSRPFWNLDKPKPWKRSGGVIIFPKELDKHNSFVVDGKNQEVAQTKDDTLGFELNDKDLAAKSFGNAGNDYYYLKLSLDSLPVIQDSIKRMKTIRKRYSVPFSAYRQLQFSDTVTRIKFKRRLAPQKAGVYLEEHNEFIPFTAGAGRTFEGRMPRARCQLAIIRKKKLYVADSQRVKAKYNSKKKQMRIRIDPVTDKQFKINKAYTPDRK